MIKEEGIGVQGHSRRASDNARALLHVASHQQHGLSFDQAIKATAQGELASPSTLRDAVEEYHTTGTLNTPTTSHRGSGNPLHPLHSPSEPTLELELAIHRAMIVVAKIAKHIAIKHIQHHLLGEAQTHISDFTLRRWMHELGYAWDDKNFIGALKPQYRDARIRTFIWEYANALRLQAAGTHIIVYLDESYIHTAHQMMKGWHPIHGPHQHNETQGDADTGKRLIILHAMTRDGMLDVEDAVGSNFLHEATPTAQFVFEAASFDESDYHNSIDGEAFTLWMKNRVMPAFQQLYPGKKMILVMDNAGYHKPHDFDWITPYKMGKAACASFLEAQEITTFDAEREDGISVSFPKRTWLMNARNSSAPTVKELQTAVKIHLKAHPGLNKTKIDKLLQPRGDSIIWTPPFVPEVQPIELIWSLVKGQVARQYTLGRTIGTTRQQTDDAFAAITKEQVHSRIGHCHRWISDWMTTEEAGSLQAFKSLDALVAADQTTPKPTDVESMITEDADIDGEDAASLQYPRSIASLPVPPPMPRARSNHTPRSKLSPLPL